MPKSPFPKVPAGTMMTEEQFVKSNASAQIEEAASILGGSTNLSASPGVPSKEEGAESKDVKSFAPPPLSNEDNRKEFIRSLLVGEPYTQTFDLFNGVYRITFATRTVKENELIDTRTTESGKNSKERNTLLVSTRRFEHAEKGPVFERKSNSPLPFLETWPETLNDVVFAAVLKAFRSFERICDEFFKHANDPDFWQETGGVR